MENDSKGNIMDGEAKRIVIIALWPKGRRYRFSTAIFFPYEERNALEERNAALSFREN